MPTAQISSASAPPDPSILQRARLRRFGVSDAVAGAIAALAYGADRRDDGALLVALTGGRCGAAAGAR